MENQLRKSFLRSLSKYLQIPPEDTIISKSKPQVKKIVESINEGFTAASIKSSELAGAILLYIHELVQRKLEDDEYLDVLEEIKKKSEIIVEEYQQTLQRSNQIVNRLNEISKKYVDRQKSLDIELKTLEKEKKKLKYRKNAFFVIAFFIFIFIMANEIQIAAIIFVIIFAYIMRFLEKKKVSIQDQIQKLTSASRNIANAHIGIESIIQAVKINSQYWRKILRKVDLTYQMLQARGDRSRPRKLSETVAKQYTKEWESIKEAFDNYSWNNSSVN
ncbi:9543_t:CDS:1 [Ambispora gerdemannii]|uniref:9543_t:CDS:1 n=1 Tax=Ambispora gerdemannii TaxID=144530 RepID=A0A9N8V2E5_9GLOM|nr:9543_t:CDS:1 [Ambispora gerdemannii]